MTRFRLISFFAAMLVTLLAADFATADPHPDEFLKFYQMPLNNGDPLYLVPPPPTHPHTDEYGTVPSRAFFPGHDELSTAIRTNPNTPYQGIYMADDFADYANTPVTHVRWWGSYLQQQPTPALGGVRRFLVSFEHNVPALIGPNGEVIEESHPDPFHPGNLHQFVDFTPGIAPPPPGMFTEKPVPTPPGPVPPPEPLFEYNAELNLGKWFNEKAAAPGTNNVYWLKIVALVDADGTTPPLQWGWHNRDWSIPNALAAKPGDTPDGAERIIGGVPVAGGIVPVWHFEDDAVQGQIFVFPSTMPNMPGIVEQPTFVPQTYMFPFDGPTTQIQLFSKDLAFELYTRVPEPTTGALLMLAIAGCLGLVRRNRS